jgi:hypothetical protein
VGEKCLLRAVLGSIRSLPTLATHPAASLGTVFHHLLELAVRGEITRTGSPAEDAESTLDRLLEMEDARLAAEAEGHVPKLSEMYSPLLWRRKRRVVLDLAAKYLSGAVPRSGLPSGSGSRNARDLPPNGSWAEVLMEAPSLRMRGRADLIQRVASDVQIRDLKTGRALTNEGEILPHIERQMRMYGTMARVLWPSAQISLVVDHGVESEVEFGREQEAVERAWLQRFLDRLPPDDDVHAESLATPGEACEGCSHRHVCLAYRKKAPNFWRTETVARMPLDTWGSVVAIVSRTDDLMDLTIRDAAGRLVKVFGLAAFRLAKAKPADEVWLFGLRTTDKRGGPELWRHPRNFFEVADDDPFARAWTVQVFAG